MLYSLNPLDYVSSATAEVPEKKKMSPEQFANKILAIPLFKSLLDTTSCYYQKTKDSLKPLKGIFHCMEELTTEIVTLSNNYIVTPLVDKVGGWDTVDSWACHLLDNLVAAVPTLKEPTEKIEDSVYSKLKVLLDVDGSEDDSGFLFNDSDVCDNAEVVETYDKVCHGKPFPSAGSDYETGDDEVLSGEHEDARNQRSSSLPLDQKGLGVRRKFSHSQGSSENSDGNEEAMNPWWKRVFRKSRRSTAKESPDRKNKDAGMKDSEKLWKSEKENSICEDEEDSIEDKLKRKIIQEMNAVKEDHKSEDKESKLQPDKEVNNVHLKAPQNEEIYESFTSSDQMNHSHYLSAN
ncbi:glutamic acid-rich protein-like [Palaemon carinicauda]|uniref:glutamic acid-rich protein-like n=1 Tax=Palaemon carinicauda TaxID=392227 RepID=UPI0035B65E34